MRQFFIVILISCITFFIRQEVFSQNSDNNLTDLDLDFQVEELEKNHIR